MLSVESELETCRNPMASAVQEVHQSVESLKSRVSEMKTLGFFTKTWRIPPNGLAQWLIRWGITCPCPSFIGDDNYY